MPLSEIKKKLNDVNATKIFFTDLNGRIRGLSVNPKNIDSIVEDGIGFDGSSIDGMTTVDDSDRLLFPITSSLRIIPFLDKTLGFFIGKVNKGKNIRSQTDPRVILEKVLEHAENEFGFRFMIGPEYEFFLLKGDEYKEAIHTDKAGYFHSDPYDKGDVVREEIVEILSRCGTTYEKNHHEVTPSQHEINFECSSPMDAADQTLLFMHVARKVASQNNYYVTFMPKPFNDFNRSAFHMHLSMLDGDGKNLFHDADNQYGLSGLALNFIGGILRYARETSIIMASTYNSYKAYTIEKEAPIARGWGIRNRSSMIRIPYSNSPESVRIELRSPDPAGNVYLQMAVFIAMGLEGIKRELNPGDPDVGNVYMNYTDHKRVWDDRILPRSMFEALAEAEKSEFLKNLLGDQLFGNYMSLKINEWEMYRTSVTSMEHSKYLVI